MTETPGSASSEETRGGAPEIIYLPDQRQRTKKVTSGSENRQRSTAIRVRVTPADAERLKTEAAAAGTSVAGYLVSGRLTDRSGDAPAHEPPAGIGRHRGADAGPGRTQSRRQ